MRTAGSKQQSQPSAHELRPQISCGREPVYRAKALLRSRDHRGTKATLRNGASGRMGRFENPARTGPESGKIHIVQSGIVRPKELVLAEWQKTLFLRNESPETRGWLLDVMKCVESLGKRDFTLDEVYAFERHLGDLYPGNQNVKPKHRHARALAAHPRLPLVVSIGST